MKTKVKNTVKTSQSILRSGIHTLKLSKNSGMVLPYTIPKWIFVYYGNVSGIFIQ